MALLFPDCNKIPILCCINFSYHKMKSSVYLNNVHVCIQKVLFVVHGVKFIFAVVTLDKETCQNW